MSDEPKFTKTDYDVVGKPIPSLPSSQWKQPESLSAPAEPAPAATEPPQAARLAAEARRESELAEREQRIAAAEQMIAERVASFDPEARAQYEQIQQRQVFQTHLGEIKKTMKTDPERWELVISLDLHNDVFQAQREAYERTGQLYDIERVADAVEAYAADKVGRLAKTRKGAAAFNGTNAAPVQKKAPDLTDKRPIGADERWRRAVAAAKAVAARKGK